MAAFDPTTGALLPFAPNVADNDVRGIVDPGFGGIVAYAVQVPQGWGMQQSITRRPTGGAYLYTSIYVRLDSPDGHTIIETLPDFTYSYVTAPNIQQFNAQMVAAGRGDPAFIPPMGPVEYLTKMILPRYAKQCGVGYRITSKQDQPLPRGNGNASGYVACDLSDGRKISTDVNILYSVGQIPGGLMYTWTADCSFVQASNEADLAQAIKHRKELGSTAVGNPVWLRRRDELAAQEQQENHERAMAQINAMAQQFQRNVQNQRVISESINNNFRQHMRATNQVTQAFCDYLGDHVLLENPSTGERTYTTNNSNYYYQDSSGSLYKSNTPLNAPGVDFTELQQVEINRYSR